MEAKTLSFTPPQPLNLMLSFSGKKMIGMMVLIKRSEQNLYFSPETM
jgi:hypothetical protein